MGNKKVKQGKWVPRGYRGDTEGVRSGYRGGTDWVPRGYHRESGNCGGTEEVLSVYKGENTWEEGTEVGREGVQSGHQVVTTEKAGTEGVPQEK